VPTALDDKDTVTETDPVDAPPAAPRRAWTSRALTVVKYVVGLVAVVLLVVGVTSRWDDISDALSRLDAGTLVLASAATLVALTANMASWRAVMGSLGLAVTPSAGASIFFVGQLGKYLPGGVWSIAAQAELGRAHGIPRGRSAVAALTSMLIGIVSASVVAVVGLLVSSVDDLAAYWWLAVVAVVGVAVVTPPVLGRLVALALRLLRRPVSTLALSWSGIGASFAWSVVMWAAYGVQATMVLRAFGSDDPSLYAVSTAAYAAAWLVGFLVIVAPAGLGAREGVLVVLLGTIASPAAALALAVLSRAIMTLGDVLLAGLGLALAGRYKARAARSAGRAASTVDTASSRSEARRSKE
jgi:uncharacterized membrane protein YbhN (UPF0104 family)